MTDIFKSSDKARVFGLGLGVDFPKALVAGLIERAKDHPPESMARITLYLNSTRMRRRITSIFSEYGSLFIPKLRLVTDLGQDFIAPHISPPIPHLRRQLELSVLIARLIEKEPDIAPHSALAELTQSLGTLMNEMQSENIAPNDIASIDVSDFSEHWQRTRRFLEIVAPYFADPQNKGNDGYQRQIVLYIKELFKTNPPKDPIIIAGSTGSRAPTALLMQLIARLPQGALVLPGFDFNMPQAAWENIKDPFTSEDHPQHRFAKLIGTLEVRPCDVEHWNSTPPYDTERNKVISLALRPAPITDQWIADGQKLSFLPKALSSVSLLEAENQRIEALSIAIRLRKAAQDKQRAALITPDRTLSRRVAAMLARWGIIPDDSAGIPLNQSAAGRFLRQVIRLLSQPLSADFLLTLLKHPLCASTQKRGEHLLFTRALEMALRKNGPVFPTPQDILAWANKQTDKQHIAQPSSLVSPFEKNGQNEQSVLIWAKALYECLNLGYKHSGTEPLIAHITRTRLLAEALARGIMPEGSGQLWKGDAGQAAFSFMNELTLEASHGTQLTAAEFRDFFDRLISEHEVRNAVRVHPDISIWGTIEARVQGAELVIIAGLNDGTWPKIASPDPWLNRKMRYNIGLSLPERRIGLSALDFQQAIAAPQVIITRALRDGEAETIPSRWLNRLMNLLAGLPNQHGPQALEEMRQRGSEWITLAQTLDRPNPTTQEEGLKPAPRPAPCPPVSARPKSLSITRIETLIRDPYAIYADKILKLRPLNPLYPEPNPRDRGKIIHKIVEAFIRERIEQKHLSQMNETTSKNEPTQEYNKKHLLQIAQKILDKEVPWPATRAIWLAQINRFSDHFLNIDTQKPAQTLLVESYGTLVIQLDPHSDMPQFTLSGTPDRIDLFEDGTLHLIDYKTGAIPTKLQLLSYAKQLHLGALIAEKGTIRGLRAPQAVSQITYVGLGEAAKNLSIDITGEDIKQTYDGLVRLLVQYTKDEQGYSSRRAIDKEGRQGDYDHLARFGEWETTDHPQNILLRHDDRTACDHISPNDSKSSSEPKAGH